MPTIIDGTISSSGLHDALEAVSRETNVKHGVLRVSSDTCSGVIGVFCARFITGAVLTLTGETGMEALHKLLSAKDGTFELVDVSDDPVREVNQSLGVDIEALLTSADLSLDSILPPEQSLTGRSLFTDHVRLIDTSIEMEVEPLAEEMTAPEEYFDEYVRADGSRGGAQSAAVDLAVELIQPSRPTLLRDVLEAEPAVEDFVIEYEHPSPVSNNAQFKGTDEFKRLKTWPARNRSKTLLFWGGTAVVVALAAAICSPHILAFMKANY